MMSRIFNGIVLGCLVILAVAILGVMGGSRTALQTAQAFPTHTDTARPCQAVIDRLGIIQQIVGDELASGKLKPLAALDECVSQQRQIDNSKCPADFRIAETRFVFTEDSLLRHAKMHSPDQSGLGIKTVLKVLGHESPDDHAEKVSDATKRDLDDVQSARLDLIQVAMNYGVK